ncbi:MAG: Hsp70 family protein [Rickettsiaceae bacterium]|nr:Hsp70 family protein [Rickettsiaceae bacterium]
MQIVGISEPGTREAENERVVGIDFGTTNSLIAISKNYQAQIIKMQDSSELVPSIIGFGSDKVIIGAEAAACKHYIRSIKRLLAKSYLEIKSNQSLLSLSSIIYNDNDIPKVEFLNTSKTLPEIASEIFRYLKTQAQIALGVSLEKAVVSVPAYFDDEARGQVLLAAKLAGLNVIRLISEPTAAAYAYGLSKSTKGSYLVYDLGGGTFDVSILNMQEGVLQVVATGGDNMLGGDDIDYAIAEYIAQELGKEISATLIQVAKKIKEKFSIKNEVKEYIEVSEVTITKKDYEKIIEPLIDKTIKIAREVLSEAEEVELDGIILVGGSTRISQISDKLKDVFGVRIYNDIDPDKIVALGAAMQAENLTAKSNSLLIDVLPLSVGLELYGGIAEKIIMRNTPIPFSVTKEYTTHTDNQTGMKFHVVQGEREMVKDCRSLAHFELTGIKPSKAGKARIQVTFSLDADGILSINAVDADTGKSHNIEIKPSHGLDEKRINDILEVAYKNAADDHSTRLLVESQEAARTLIKGIKSALDETPELLSDLEHDEMKKAINSLQKVINSDNRDIILLKADNLNQLAANFIQKHLDKGADLFLKNKYINEIKFDK